MCGLPPRVPKRDLDAARAEIQRLRQHNERLERDRAKAAERAAELARRVVLMERELAKIDRGLAPEQMHTEARMRMWDEDVMRIVDPKKDPEQG